MSLPSSPLQPVSQNQAEVLYSTRRFRVLLWHLNAGQTWELPGLLGDDASVRESQCLVISGKIAIAGESDAWGKGRRFVLSAPHKIQAAGDAPVSLLELQWGQGFPEIPLREVTETRPWGSFTVLKDEPDYKLKQLAVTPGNRLSLQRHFKREEHWLITQGQPEVFLDEKIHCLKPEGYIHIPRQSWHRITNPEQASGSVEIIELQLGDYFGEDDIERRQDDYGRR